jgi:hypothetical protein
VCVVLRTFIEAFGRSTSREGSRTASSTWEVFGEEEVDRIETILTEKL